MTGPRALPVLVAILFALAFPLGESTCQETRYYSSDEAGFQGEELRGARVEGYALGVTRSPSSSLRILYRDGREIRRTLRETTGDGFRESVTEGKSLLEERIYDRAGNLMEEFLYEGPSADGGKTAPEGASGEGLPGDATAARLLPVLASHLVYTYLSGRLASVESLDASSRSQGTLEYRYDAEGRLLELRASGTFGTSTAGEAPGASLPAASWFAVPAEGRAAGGKDSIEITRYDAAGRPVERASYEGDDCLVAEIMVYDASGRLARSRSYEAGTHTMSEMTYDDRGHIVLVVVSVDGVEKSRESSVYDDASRLVEKTIVASSSTTRTSYAYDGTGETSRETVEVDGILASVTVNLADGTIVRELYDKGRLFLRAYYSDGRLRKEEFVEAGAVVRTREYP